MSIKAGTAFLLMLSLSLPVMPATAEDRYDPYRPGLAPGQVEQIQGIGQSVLSARRGQMPDPDLALLRQHVDDLRRAVEKLHDATMRSGMSDRIRISGSPGGIDDLARMETENRRVERKAAEDEASWTLIRVRSEREAMERRLSSDPEKGRVQGAAAKLKELEDAMEKILQSPPQEQIAQMKALKDRLTVSGKTQVEPEKTPTITSITHHR